MEHTEYETYRTRGWFGRFIKCLLLSLIQTELHDIHKIEIKKKYISIPGYSKKLFSYPSMNGLEPTIPSFSSL
jgi:hypothetical protein